MHLSSHYRVVRDFLNVRVNQNSQVTDAGVRNDFKYFHKTLFFNMLFYLAF
jgi:hypothetical protein